MLQFTVITIRQTPHLAHILVPHEECFPYDEPYIHKDNIYWIARNGTDDAGFCVATKYSKDVLFLSRAGVIKEYRGMGIHQRLINVRLRYARQHDYKTVITYTSPDNFASINNLVHMGFRLYNPEYKYAGKEFTYLRIIL